MKYFSVSTVFALLICPFAFARPVAAGDVLIYGFGQIDYKVSDRKGTNSTIDITRINYISEFQLSENSRFFNEIEYEQGPDLSGDALYGGIKLCQAWVEYRVGPELRFNFGKVYTNFGLYNLVHDVTPSFLQVDIPFMYSRHKIDKDSSFSQRLYGKYMTGLTANGTLDLGSDGSQIEYSFSFGVGRSEIVNDEFINENTSYAGRIIYRPSFLPGGQIGASFYTDRNKFGAGGAANGIESTFGLDIQHQYGSYLFQIESILASFADYKNNPRKALIGYALFGYTLWDNLTPYIIYSLADYNFSPENTADDVKPFSVVNFGLNYALSSQLFIKAEIGLHSRKANVYEENINELILSVSFAY